METREYKALSDFLENIRKSEKRKNDLIELKQRLGRTIRRLNADLETGYCIVEDDVVLERIQEAAHNIIVNEIQKEEKYFSDLQLIEYQKYYPREPIQTAQETCNE